MNGDLKDRELIERLNNYEESAIEAVFHRFYVALCFFANKIVHDQEASKDIVQEVFARLFEKQRYRYENMASLKAFLYNSVHNEAIDSIRRKEKSRKVIRDAPFAPFIKEVDIEYQELEVDILTKVLEAIERLPASCRIVFKMSYLDRMSIREISDALNIAESTVKTQRQRAKEHLKKWLQDLYSATT